MAGPYRARIPVGTPIVENLPSIAGRAGRLLPVNADACG